MAASASGRTSPKAWRIRQAPWLLASIVFVAWGHLNFTTGLLAESGSLFSAAELQIGWSLGWPLPFCRVNDEALSRFLTVAFLADLIVGTVVVGGTAFSARRWRIGEGVEFVPNLKTMMTIGITMLVWIFMARSTNVALMASWFSLLVVFAATPCAAYAVVAVLVQRRIPRYDLRTMFLVMTVICLAAAVGSALRSPHLAALLILLFCVVYGAWSALSSSDRGTKIE